jgi:hypothetical protein
VNAGAAVHLRRVLVGEDQCPPVVDSLAPGPPLVPSLHEALVA